MVTAEKRQGWAEQQQLQHECTKPLSMNPSAKRMRKHRARKTNNSEDLRTQRELSSKPQNVAKRLRRAKSAKKKVDKIERKLRRTIRKKISPALQMDVLALYLESRTNSKRNFMDFLCLLKEAKYLSESNITCFECDKTIGGYAARLLEKKDDGNRGYVCHGCLPGEDSTTIRTMDDTALKRVSDVAKFFPAKMYREQVPMVSAYSIDLSVVCATNLTIDAPQSNLTPGQILTSIPCDEKELVTHLAGNDAPRLDPAGIDTAGVFGKGARRWHVNWTRDTTNRLGESTFNTFMDQLKRNFEERFEWQCIDGVIVDKESCIVAIVGPAKTRAGLHLDHFRAFNVALAINDTDAKDLVLAIWLFVHPRVLPHFVQTYKNRKEPKTEKDFRQLAEGYLPGEVKLVEQRHSQQIEIPPGLAHDVFNVKDNIKVAIDGLRVGDSRAVLETYDLRSQCCLSTSSQEHSNMTSASEDPIGLLRCVVERLKSYEWVYA